MCVCVCVWIDRRSAGLFLSESEKHSEIRHSLSIHSFVYYTVLSHMSCLANLKMSIPNACMHTTVNPSPLLFRPRSTV